MVTDDLVAEYWGLARHLAASYARRWPGAERHDIESDANLGLTEAARTWDPHGGMNFNGWARIKIRGAILDGFGLRHGRDANRRRGRGIRRIAGAPKAEWRHVPFGEPGEVLEIPGRCDPGFGLVELAASLEHGFTDRERGVIVELAEGLTLAEVGERRGVTESRACQMRAAIRARAVELDLA